MASILNPTIYVNSFEDISLELLKRHNIKGLLCDLDETLVGHNVQSPDQPLLEWIKSIKSYGIQVCIISNNTEKRTSQFAKKINVPYVCNAMKPTTRRILRSIPVLNLKNDEVAFMGDQLFTDIKAANDANLKSILVDPRGGESMWFVKLKRRREKKYKQIFKKENI